jgi:hypothetical protein
MCKKLNKDKDKQKCTNWISNWNIQVLALFKGHQPIFIRLILRDWNFLWDIIYSLWQSFSSADSLILNYLLLSCTDHMSLCRYLSLLNLACSCLTFTYCRSGVSVTDAARTDLPRLRPCFESLITNLDTALSPLIPRFRLWSLPRPLKIHTLHCGSWCRLMC